jgi:hypothetical protein
MKIIYNMLTQDMKRFLSEFGKQLDKHGPNNWQLIKTDSTERKMKLKYSTKTEIPSNIR